MDKAIHKTDSVAAPMASSAAIMPVKPEMFGDVQLSAKALSQIIVSLQSNRRQAPARTKTRGEVAGSTRKPWRQKGTGRARVGTRRTPLWRGGGTVFGPTGNRNFTQKINRQVLPQAIRAVLASKAARGEVLEAQSVPPSTKTKTSLAWLSSVLDPKSNLIVVTEGDLKLMRTLRNVSYIKPVATGRLSLLDIACHRKVIFLPGTLDRLQAKLDR